MMEVEHTVTIDRYYSPWTFRPKIDNDPPTTIVFHDEARWFLERAPRLSNKPVGLGLCGIMTVADPPNSAPATIYLWPLQTPHTIDNGNREDVPGMTDLKPWPVAAGFPSWADKLVGKPQPVLKHFQQADKNLHVFPAANNLTVAAAHSQLQVAIRLLENVQGLSYVGITLYYNLAAVGDTKFVVYAPGHHLLRCLSRSQNNQYFTNRAGESGTVPDEWAQAIKRALDDYFKIKYLFISFVLLNIYSLFVIT